MSMIYQEQNARKYVLRQFAKFKQDMLLSREIWMTGPLYYLEYVYVSFVAIFDKTPPCCMCIYGI